MSKKFRTILADPPWYQAGGGKIKRGADRHYSLLKEWQIKSVMAEFLMDKIEEDAHLYMWVANNHLPEALKIIEHLGFRYITNVVWAKTSFGLGQYFRGQHEICLFAVRGKGMKVKSHARNISSLVGGMPIKATRHSKKPEAMYELIEKRSIGPYLEMFARNYRDGWSSWGNEVEPFVKEEKNET